MHARSAARRLTEQKTIDRLSYSLSLFPFAECVARGHSPRARRNGPREEEAEGCLLSTVRRACEVF